MKLNVRIDQEKAKASAIRVFAATGLMVMLVIAAFGAVRFGSVLPLAFKNLSAAAVSLSSVFTPADHITLSAPVSADSGSTITLTWSRRSTRSGSFTLSYPCDTGASVTAANASGTFEDTFCATPFNFGAATSATQIIATAGAAVSLPITITFTPENNPTHPISDTAIIAITGASVPTTTTSTVSKPAPLSAGSESNRTYPLVTGNSVPHSNANHADLKATIIAVGTVDRLTNQFTETTTIKASERGAVRFSIENVGGVSSGSWTFAAVLPTVPLYVFNSEPQRSLNPGDRIEFTLGFDSIDTSSDTGKITINADPTHSIQEVTEDNNIVSTTVSVSK